MIIVQNPPSMIANRKPANASSASPAAKEVSFCSQDISNLTIGDRMKMNLTLTNLEPRRAPTTNGDLVVPTRPSTGEACQSTPTPTQILFPKHVTEEQEAYARGFAKALEELYRQQGPPTSAAARGVECSVSSTQIGDKTGCLYEQTTFSSPSFFKEANSSIYNGNQPDTKPAIFEPSFVSLAPVCTSNDVGGGGGSRSIDYPSLVEDIWQPPQTFSSRTTSSSFSHASSSSQIVTSTPLMLAGSLPSSTSILGQKRPLSRVSSQSLNNLPNTNSPCGSDVSSQSRSLTGEFGALDMEEQEKLRLERKRAKNRVAAQKCQMKKVERIQQLENKVAYLKSKNLSLSSKASGLRQSIEQLKSTITLHVSQGCRILSSGAYNSSEVMTSLA